MITLGDCSDCGNCGGSLCDRIVFLKGATAEPTDLGQYKYWNEGATVTVNVARIPDCFGWDGTPDEYNTANGSYPPVGVDGYYYDYGARNFWKNIAGTFTADAGPAEYGTGAVSVSWAVTREECGCNHMWSADSGTLTWTAGDIADKTITLTTPAHAGTVPFWACPGPLFGEAATLALTLVSAPRCVTIGYDLTISAVCTHLFTNGNWGSQTAPYQIRKWGAMVQSSAGIDGFRDELNWLRAEETTDGTTSGDAVAYNYAKQFAQEGDIVLEYSHTHNGALERFDRPVATSEPVLLPIVQTGLPASTPGNSGDYAIYGGRFVEGQPFGWSHVANAAVTYKFKKNGAVVASGSANTGDPITYSVTPAAASDSGSYVLEVSYNPPTIFDPRISDSAEIVVIGQTVNAVTDAEVDVAGSGGGETWQWTGAMTGAVLEVYEEARDRLDSVVAAEVDGNLPNQLSGASFPGFSGWDQTEPDEWTWRIRASWDDGFFEAPAFDPAKTYEYTGVPNEIYPQYPGHSVPADPGDWTEIADTGFVYQQLTSGYTQATGYIASQQGRSERLSGKESDTYGTHAGIILYESTIDATNSATGTPYPTKVEIRLITYLEGVIDSTGPWFEITDTIYNVPAPDPVDFVIFPQNYWTEVEYRLTHLYNNGGTCSPIASPTFVCHPGLTC